MFRRSETVPEQALDKTVVIQAPAEPQDLPDPDATVVIRPARAPQNEPDPDKTVVIAAPAAQTAEADLDKTVVIGQAPPTPPPASGQVLRPTGTGSCG